MIFKNCQYTSEHGMSYRPVHVVSLHLLYSTCLLLIAWYWKSETFLQILSRHLVKLRSTLTRHPESHFSNVSSQELAISTWSLFTTYEMSNFEATWVFLLKNIDSQRSTNKFRKVYLHILSKTRFCDHLEKHNSRWRVNGLKWYK